MFRQFVFMVLLIPCTVAVIFMGVVWAADCGTAGKLSIRSLTVPSNATKEKLLQKALSLCPKHVQALNNLALLREAQGRTEEAETLYFQVLEVNPSFIQAYAGLGDVQAANNRYRQAAQSYHLIQEGLQTEKQKGDPLGLAAHEGTYQRRMNDAVAKSRETLGAASIKRKLTTQASINTSRRTRGVRPVWRDQVPPQAPRVDLHIQFSSGSARLSDKSAKQLKELATALLDPVLVQESILIIGHTDNLGEYEYNQIL